MDSHEALHPPHDDRLEDEGDHEHDLGLAHDLATLAGRAAGPSTPSATTAPPGPSPLGAGIAAMADHRLDRRRALALIGGGGLATIALAACGRSGSSTSAAETTATTAATATTASGSGSSTSTSGGDPSTAIPEETNGPYPADGSNGPNVLTESGIVRQDITTSFGSMSGTAAGVPLTLRMQVLDTSGAPRSGAAIYVWHCDGEGRYSLYSSGATDQNWLRGVQIADDEGNVAFTSVFPGCYDGRWPHIHFEVYPSESDATAASNRLVTSQIALPQDACEAAYTSSAYPTSASNLSRVSLDTDMVFRDGYAQELATVSGDASSGFTAQLRFAVG